MVLSVVAKIKVKDGQQAAFEAVASKLAAAVNANEPGCLLYTLNKGDDPLTYVFLERYADEDAVKAHRARAAVLEDVGHLRRGQVGADGGEVPPTDAPQAGDGEGRT